MPLSRLKISVPGTQPMSKPEITGILETKPNQTGYERNLFTLPEELRWLIRQRQLQEGTYIPRLCLDQTRILKHYLLHCVRSKHYALSSLLKRRIRTTMSLRSSICCTHISYSSSLTYPTKKEHIRDKTLNFVEKRGLVISPNDPRDEENETRSEIRHRCGHCW